MRVVLSFFLLVAVVLSLPAHASCEFDFSIENWLKSFDSEKDKQKPIIDKLQACLPDDKQAQAKVDDLAISSLQAAHVLDEDIRASFILYNLEILRINANAGYPSSQHNYAVLHNAEQGTLLAKVIPQDYKTFIYWSKKAAAQGEPRAMFNLAVRFADKQPPEGMRYRPELAYQLFLLLKRDYGQNPELPGGMKKIINEQLDSLEAHLGKKKASRLRRNLSSFDYSTIDS